MIDVSQKLWSPIIFGRPLSFFTFSSQYIIYVNFKLKVWQPKYLFQVLILKSLVNWKSIKIVTLKKNKDLFWICVSQWNRIKVSLISNSKLFFHTINSVFEGFITLKLFQIEKGNHKIWSNQPFHWIFISQVENATALSLTEVLSQFHFKEFYTI